MVVLFQKNQRPDKDPEYAKLLSRVHLGMAWDGHTEMLNIQCSTGKNYNEPDDITLRKRDICMVLSKDQQAKDKFKDVPIIVVRRKERDRINTFKVQQSSLGKKYIIMQGIKTSDALGKLLLVPGMKVMVTENIAMMARVVNGSEGHLVNIKWDKDEAGRCYAKCAYVKGNNGEYLISRKQLPLIPAYAYTDYKCQGRTLDAALVNIDCKTLQVRKIYTQLSQEFRNEFYRLEGVDRRMAKWLNGLKTWCTLSKVRSDLLSDWPRTTEPWRCLPPAFPGFPTQA
ncbi:hypothetical protein K438DRAFT_1770659 [Mycena galopus ATCC 62051]|nr:hypothetical protein K438DRAFT_1770659 [Mycena galopus ATCC 62051]